MKRFVLFALLVLGIVTLAYAQDWGHRNRNREWEPRTPRHENWGNGMAPWGRQGIPQFSSEVVTVSGDLTIVQGALAVKSGNTTYLVMGLSRFIGFIAMILKFGWIT